MALCLETRFLLGILVCVCLGVKVCTCEYFVLLLGNGLSEGMLYTILILFGYFLRRTSAHHRLQWQSRQSGWS